MVTILLTNRLLLLLIEQFSLLFVLIGISLRLVTRLSLTESALLTAFIVSVEATLFSVILKHLASPLFISICRLWNGTFTELIELSCPHGLLLLSDALVRSHNRDYGLNMSHIVRVELPQVDFLSFLTQIDAFRHGLIKLGGDCDRHRLAHTARWNLLLLLILLRQLYLSNLVPDVLKALFLKLAHEIAVAFDLLKEKFTIDFVKLSRRREAR